VKTVQDLIEEIGEVVATTGDTAKVRITRHSSCDRCGACWMGGKQQIVIEVTNGIGAQKGDAVILEIQSKFLFKAAFLMYLIPLMTLILGFLAGERIGLSLGTTRDTAENIGIFFGFIFLAVSFLFIRWWDRQSQLGLRFRPALVRVVAPGNYFSADPQK
jgi:sigma-E factor negative regulatory protein RseC